MLFKVRSNHKDLKNCAVHNARFLLQKKKVEMKKFFILYES